MEGNLTDGIGTYSPFDEKPSDEVLEKAAFLAAQHLPVQSKVVEYLIDRVRKLEESNGDLLQSNINLNALASEAKSIARYSRNEALEEAAEIASNACLVPPDGGSPTEAEANMCDGAAKRIRALKDKGA